MNIQRITRLLKILQMLQAGAGDNVDGIAEMMGVSRRTAFRDIEALKESGVPVAYDRESDRYSVVGDYLLPPTNFTPREALAIICLATEAGREDTLPFYGAAVQAALKIEASLPADTRQQIAELTRGIRVRPPQIHPHENGDHAHQELSHAQAKQLRVWVVYDSLFERKTIETVLNPYSLMFAHRAWYVVGRSSLHKEIRTFHLGRIESLRVLDEPFKPQRGFSLDRYLGNAWRMIPEPGPDHEVHLHFKPMVARNVSEIRWHATQRLEWREDGSLDFYATVSGVKEISWWVLQYGHQVEVLEPAPLRRLIAERVRDMAKMYGV